jgi:hypothetical protein
MNTIDVTSDDTLTLREACSLLPRGRHGSKPHLSTLLRWITVGVPGPGGGRIKLAAVRCGAKWVTSRAALREFVQALTPRPNGEPAAPTRTPTQRSRAATRADKALEAAGFSGS